jgi:hypothetical protein
MVVAPHRQPDGDLTSPEHGPDANQLPTLLPQSDFQRRAFSVAQAAHSAVDRADARILMGIIEVVGDGDLRDLSQLMLALQSKYRDQLGSLPDASKAPAEHLSEGDAAC